jgi:hypothetical protein
MGWSEPRRWLRALLASALVASAPASAEGDEGSDLVPLDITVLRVSDEPGEVDPRVERVDRLLRGQVAYQSLAIVDVHRREVPVNEVWTFELPTGRHVELRPLEVDKTGALLLSLDVEDGLQGDFRVRPGQPLIVGGVRVGEDKLILVVESR